MDYLNKNNAEVGVKVTDNEYGVGRVTFTNEDKTTLFIKFDEQCGISPDLPLRGETIRATSVA